MKNIDFTKTELHTHLVGMLSLEDFVNFIKSFGIAEVKLRNGDIIKTEDMLTDDYKRLFCVPRGERVDYRYLNVLYENRTAILNSIGPELCRCGIFPSNTAANKVVFNRLINESLRSLVNQGVKYVEISYSFPDRINDFEIDEEFKDKIQCRFLLSTNRINKVKSEDNRARTFERSAKDLRKIIDGPNDVGFDIMGEESILVDEELDYEDPYHSFERKMELIIKAMMDNNGKVKNNTVLRIHSGETPICGDNTINTLRFLKSIEERNGIKMPPPEIRIGHGVYFEKSDEYIKLLKDLKCIIEINASSNIALSNIESSSDLPYEYYLENDIPIVLSTDGEGLYSTSVRKEDLLAKYSVGSDDYGLIKDIDQIILDGKVR